MTERLPFGRLMPFMFKPIRLKDGSKSEYIEDGKVVVLIARWDLSYQDTGWMGNERLGKDCSAPSVDIVEEEHEFIDEEAAMKFIMEWWIEQHREHFGPIWDVAGQK